MNERAGHPAGPADIDQSGAGQMKPLVLNFALPLGKEARWSDLLAVLIATDPAPISAVLDLRHDPSTLAVHREVAVDSTNRPDIVLAVGDGAV